MNSAYRQTLAPPQAPSAAPRWLDTLVHRSAALAWRLQRQRQRRRLLELPAYRLRDMGITREQAVVEGSKPLWRD